MLRLTGAEKQGARALGAQVARARRNGDLHAIMDRLRRELARDARLLAAAPTRRWLRDRFRFHFAGELLASRDGWDGDPGRYLLSPARPDPSMPPPGRTRARATLIFVSGIFDPFAPTLALADAFDHLRRRGHRVRRLRLPTFGAIAPPDRHRDAVLRAVAATRRPVLLVGYSKGGPDILEALDHLERNGGGRAAGRVRAVLTVAGANGGSPLADAVVPVLQRRLARMRRGRERLSALVEALDSLTTVRRRAFLRRCRLPAVPLFHLGAVAALADVPAISRFSKRYLDRIDPANDMQVLCRDARLPGPLAVDLGSARAHHWSLAFPVPDRGHLQRRVLDPTWFLRDRLPAALARRLAGPLGGFWALSGRLGNDFSAPFPRAEVLCAAVSTMEEAGLFDPR